MTSDAQPDTQDLPEDDESSFGEGTSTYDAATTSEAEQNVAMANIAYLATMMVVGGATVPTTETFLVDTNTDTSPLEQLISYETTQIQVMRAGGWVAGFPDIGVLDFVQELGPTLAHFSIGYDNEQVLGERGTYAVEYPTFAADEIRWDEETLFDAEVNKGL